MKLDFSGKRVAVTGGSRGIGRSIALAFAGAGASVSICARGEAMLKQTAKEIEELGVKSHHAALDLADRAAVRAYIEQAAAALSGLDVLVNNASGFGRTDDEEGWEISFQIDVMASVIASNAAIVHLARAGGGSIIHISSISGLGPSVRTPPYGAVKAALIQYTQTQAASLAKQRIRVNCIAPGSIEFPGGLWDLAKQNNPDLYYRILKGIPFDRLGRPEEIANVALFLASDLASWVTGQTITADGGQMLA